MIPIYLYRNIVFMHVTVKRIQYYKYAKIDTNNTDFVCGRHFTAFYLPLPVPFHCWIININTSNHSLAFFIMQAWFGLELSLMSHF